MPAAPPNSRAMRHDRRLAKIVSAAARVFAAEGYDRASIRSVAQRAGVSVPGLYHYVQSKEELLFLIQQRVFHDLVETFKAENQGLDGPEARLELLVHRHLERFLTDMSELVVCSREMDRLQGKYRQRIQFTQREYFRLAVHLFEELREQYGGANVEPRTAALALFGSINWIYTWYRPGSGASASWLAKEFVQLFLHGLLPEGVGT